MEYLDSINDLKNIQIKSLTWESEKVFFDGDLFFDDIISHINTATKSIEVETYIFETDNLGVKVIENLIQADKRGVKIKILIDAFGSFYAIGYLKKHLKNTNIQLEVYHPLSIRNFFRYFYLFNHRNHRKNWIIDNKIAYIGSFNVSSVHLKSCWGNHAWKDYGVRVSGKYISLIRQAFNWAWEKRSFANKVANIIPLKNTAKKITTDLVILNYNLKKRRQNYHDFLEKISHAKKRIWLVNAYFLPGPKLVKGMCESARRGIDVRLIVPNKSDVFFMPWITATFYNYLLKGGVKVYEYLPSVLHAKARVIDDWMILGSSNLNHRSLLHDLEIDVMITLAENQRSLENEIIEEFNRSKLITFTDLNKISWIKKLLAKFFLLIKYWL